VIRWKVSCKPLAAPFADNSPSLEMDLSFPIHIKTCLKKCDSKPGRYLRYNCQEGCLSSMVERPTHRILKPTHREEEELFSPYTPQMA